MVLPFVLCLYETLVVTLREGYSLGILRKRMWKKIFGRRRKEGSKEGREEENTAKKLQN